MKIIYNMWWKLLAVVLVMYTLIAGLLIPVPAKYLLNETIRNLYFHVPMWFAMFTVFSISVFYSIKYLAFLLYCAYLVLRNSIDEEQKRAKIAAIYNIFAFPIMIVLLVVLPRMTDSLHPGSGGNPGFNAYDMDKNMRYVLYPALIGWSFLGVWIATLRYRMRLIEYKNETI
jgi:heme exporter protein C